MIRTEVTVKCIDDCDNTCAYNCTATYSKQGNTLIQSETDDHTKALASDALYMTLVLLCNQIKKAQSNGDRLVWSTKNSMTKAPNG